MTVLGQDTMHVASLSDSAVDSFQLVPLDQHPMLENQKVKLMLSTIERPAENRTFSFFIALGSLFVLALLRHIFPQYLTNLFAVFNVFSSSKRSPKGQLENDTKASFGFYFLYILNLWYVAYMALRLLVPRPAYTTMQWIVVSVCLVLAIVVAKAALTAFVAWVFKQEEMARQYRFTNSIVNEFTGMFLIPVSLLILLTSNATQRFFVITALVILAVSVVVKYLKNHRVMNNLLRIDFLHFLLYLCAFEIVPLFIFFKIVTEH